MKRALSALASIGALAGAGWLVACANRVAGGGDATETGNARIRGIVVMEDGLPARGAEVTILPSDYDPVKNQSVPDSLKDTTDIQGRYRFTSLPDGNYNVAVRDNATRTRLSIYGIALTADSVSVPADTLHAPGSISIPLAETGDTSAGWVYIPGTQLRMRVDAEMRLSGSVIIDSLAPGVVPVLMYTQGDADSRPVVLARTIQVAEQKVTQLSAYAAWPHARKLILNTATGSTAIVKSQFDFPLLVRLAAPGFDFSQTFQGGADLRFSAANGLPLSHEIETWDSTGGKADVWVRVDTIHGGRADQAITLHWGAMASTGNRRPVFDTLAGFAGVWHLGEEAADTTVDGIYRDATGAGSHGNDRVTSQARSGVIGAGRGIDSGDYIVVPQPSSGFRLTRSFTLLAWFRANGQGLGPKGGEVLNIGDNYGLRVVADTSLHLWYWPAVPPAGAMQEWYSMTIKVPGIFDSNWHQVMGTFDGTALRLYADGKGIGTMSAPDTVGLQFPLNVTMGKHGNNKRGYEYQGNLDEAQVHGRTRDGDWAKLSYENQRPGSRFPAFAP